MQYLLAKAHFWTNTSPSHHLRQSPFATDLESMEYFSLKRSSAADRGGPNLSSKVYVRSTKSGKVQKIVRELYLRKDIPCSSNLCRACLDIAPTDFSKKGRDRASRLHVMKGS